MADPEPHRESGGALPFVRPQYPWLMGWLSDLALFFIFGYVALEIVVWIDTLRSRRTRYQPGLVASVCNALRRWLDR